MSELRGKWEKGTGLRLGCPNLNDYSKMMTSEEKCRASIALKPMPIWESLLFFGIPTLLLYFATHLGIPLLERWLDIPPEICWFLSGGSIVFLPLLTASIIAYFLENKTINREALKSRFRLQPMNRQDWIWGLLSILGIGMGTAIVIAIASSVFESFSPSPPFLSSRMLPANERWILLAWLPFFFLNIMGEEMMWRGYILPRQELTHGENTWLVHGLLWLMFHLSFGPYLLLVLLPIIFILPWVVQRRQNTWIGVLIHATINGGGFLAISLGWVSG